MKTLLATICVGLLSAAAQSQLKVPKGSVHRFLLETSLRQKAKGSTMKLELSREFSLQLFEEKGATYQLIFTRAAGTTTSGFGSMSFDSKTPASNKMLTPGAARWLSCIDKPLTLTVGQSGELKTIEGIPDKAAAYGLTSQELVEELSGLFVPKSPKNHDPKKGWKWDRNVRAAASQVVISLSMMTDARTLTGKGALKGDIVKESSLSFTATPTPNFCLPSELRFQGVAQLLVKAGSGRSVPMTLNIDTKLKAR